ncbi:MAG: hypothetical protein JOY60_03510 [Burkholderiaceae bacterium]|nr:hypothetical protein [Burkholderiaceae bacterium]
MNVSAVRFQSGVSTPECLTHLGTQAPSIVALTATQWPVGFRIRAARSRNSFLTSHGTGLSQNPSIDLMLPQASDQVPRK